MDGLLWNWGDKRIAQAAIEQNYDQKGICWPIQISPFEVIIIPTNLKDPIQSDLTEQIYNNFLINKIDVLLCLLYTSPSPRDCQ